MGMILNFMNIILYTFGNDLKLYEYHVCILMGMILNFMKIIQRNDNKTIYAAKSGINSEIIGD